MRALARVTLALVAILAPLFTVTTASYADHPGPSAAAVARAKAQAAHLEQQVAAAAAQVARTQDDLDRLRTSAEVAAEAYDHAVVRQQAAQQALDAARLVLAAATARVGAARSSVGRFAVAAYEGGTMSTVDAVLTSQNPAAMIYRIGALDEVSRAQRDVLQSLRAAQVYESVMRKQAADALAGAQQATAAAGTAKAAAQQAVDVQVAAVARVTDAQHRLTAMLTAARAHASALERARLQAIARARAEAAARAARLRAEQLRRQQALAAAQAAQAASQSSSGSGSPSGGYTGGGSGGAVVSAGTEAAALRYAESQVGKPYQWGAAGPDTYDCSGLVMWSYAQVGVHVDHWTGYQWNEGEHIPLSSLRAGDLLFFATDTSNPDTIHHVGMYVGNGQMVEAPYTGADVRYSYAFRPDLIGAVRFYNR